jgi:hypothetical protein
MITPYDIYTVIGRWSHHIHTHTHIYMSASKLRLRPISDWPRRMSDPTLDDIFSGHSRIKCKTYVQSKIGLEKSGESEIGLGHSQIEKFVRRI